MIGTGYVPTADAALHGIVNVPVDLLLLFHSRINLLVSVTDENTLTRIQSRSRRYAPAEDPTDQKGGTLRPLNTSIAVYHRLVVSDADLSWLPNVERCFSSPIEPAACRGRLFR